MLADSTCWMTLEKICVSIVVACSHVCLDFLKKKITLGADSPEAISIASVSLEKHDTY